MFPGADPTLSDALTSGTVVAGTVVPVWLVVTAATVGALVLLVLVVLTVRGARRMAARRGVRGDRVVTLVAAGVALGLSADGAYRLLTRSLGLPPWEAIVVAAVAELAIVAEAVRAERSIRRHGHPSGHHWAVGGIALGAGFVVSSGASSVPEWLVRFLVPQLAALLWWMGAREELADRRLALAAEASQEGAATPASAASPERVTWLISPRRLAVQAGLIAAGADDLGELTRARRVRILARLLHRHARSRSTMLRRWRAGRIHRLAETVDEASIAGVREQLLRTRAVLAMAGLVAEGSTGDGLGWAAPVPTAPVPAAAPVSSAPVPAVLAAAQGLSDDVQEPGRRIAQRRTTRRAHRPGDLARVRAAVAEGRLPSRPSATAIASLLGISRPYASAARDAFLDGVAAGVASDAATDAPGDPAREVAVDGTPDRVDGAEPGADSGRVAIEPKRVAVPGAGGDGPRPGSPAPRPAAPAPRPASAEDPTTLQPV